MLIPEGQQLFQGLGSTTEVILGPNSKNSCSPSGSKEGILAVLVELPLGLLCFVIQASKQARRKTRQKSVLSAGYSLLVYFLPTCSC